MANYLVNNVVDNLEDPIDVDVLYDVGTSKDRIGIV